jgi:hypothetical protein
MPYNDGMATVQDWRAAVDGLQSDVRAVVGDRLRAVVAYEAHGVLGETTDEPSAGAVAELRHDAQVHTLVLVDALGFHDLAQLAPQAAAWRKRGLAVPLVLSPSEFTQSLDAFPLELSQMAARHVVVYGKDPFAAATVLPADLRRACETQARSHLVHLREGFLQAGGSPRALAELVAASVIPLRALLVNIARLEGVDVRGSVVALATFAEERLHLPMDGLRPLLTPKPARHFESSDVGAFFQGYLAAMERLVAVVDQWRA